MEPDIPQCTCDLCRLEVRSPERELHHWINLVMSRLDEQQRRWVAAVLAERYGRGGMELVSLITGISERTIRRGRQELEADLEGLPLEGIRRSFTKRSG